MCSGDMASVSQSLCISMGSSDTSRQRHSRCTLLSPVCSLCESILLYFFSIITQIYCVSEFKHTTQWIVTHAEYDDGKHIICLTLSLSPFSPS